jgi:hypothetical protein
MSDYGTQDDAVILRFMQCQKGCTFPAGHPAWNATTQQVSGDGPFACPYDGSHVKLL